MVVDFSSLCPPKRTIGISTLNILPLARVIWANPNIKCQIVFEDANRKLERELHTDWSDDKLGADIETEVLNNILHVVAVEDTLNVKRYGACERLMNSIWVSRNLKMVGVHYPTARFAGPLPRFSVFDKGKVLQRTKQASSDLFYNKYSYINSNIITAILNTYGGICIELDRKRIRGFNINLLWVDRRMRESLLSNFWKDTPVTVQMTVTNPNNLASGLELLRKWLKEDMIGVRYPRRRNF